MAASLPTVTMDRHTALSVQERRIEELERRVQELEEWLTELADDMLDRQGVA